MVDTTVIKFERDSYTVFEDIGKKGFALRVCIIISNFSSPRTVRITTVSGVAQGMCGSHRYIENKH